ncbi:MAG TPA: serine hydrolase domain-containing protein [Streptosporangiaceae bacterium]|nr:serine hydrolase domain-containing protein [Streptosporangiaceae bacterium]
MVAGPVAAGAQDFQTKVASFVREHRLYGAAAGVVHGDELVWSGGAGFADAAAGRPSGADVLYRIASITKTFTGTAIMQLRDAGLIDLDDPAVKWIPELSDSASPAQIGSVSIRRLLSHESGLVSEPPGTDFLGVEPRYEGLMSRNLERVAEIFAAVPPNTQTKYCNLGYQLLGEVVHRVSGIPYPQYVAERILAPLAMSSTGFEPLPDALAGRRATGYAERAFSDELSVAPAMPPIWAEGGLWSTVEDLARWLSFQVAAHAEDAGAGDASPGSDVLASATRREMHKPRYLSDEDWSTAWGITWYSVRKDNVTWVQHSGGLPGFISNACFDRGSRVGAIVLLNGVADASGLAMSLAAAGRDLATAAAPELRRPVPTPPDVVALLGFYAPPDMSFLVKVEWRDGKLTLVDTSEPGGEKIPLDPAAEPGSFVAAPGYRPSGEPVQFGRRPDGTVESLSFGGGLLVRLDPVR